MRRPSALLSGSLLLSGCAFASSEWNLAPLFAKHRNAWGGTSWEALGGILRGESRPQGEEFALHPVFRATRDAGNVSETDFLYPLGYGRDDGKEVGWRFLPFYWWKDHVNEKGEHDVDWWIFPLFFGGKAESGERYFALFPFYGTLRDFLSFDRMRFVLFPLYLDTEKANGRRSTNLLWPFFGWASGGGQSSLRVFPFFSYSGHEGRYERYSVLWPLIHFGRTDLDKKKPGSYFFFFPFYGQSSEKGLEAWTVLPPFLFGSARNENTGYRGYDFLWPLGKVERGGSRPERTRFLPFFAFYEGKEVKSRAFLWPLVWFREEEDARYVRHSLYILPFWHSWTKVQKKGGESSYWHAWPLAHREWSADGTGDLSFPSPLFFRHKAHRLDENLWPLYTLYRQRTGALGESSSRVIADLLRREAGHGEDRLSVPILFGRRAREDGAVEWSFLAGLLRFRKDSRGFGMMAPSFPGPGWD